MGRTRFVRGKGAIEDGEISICTESDQILTILGIAGIGDRLAPMLDPIPHARKVLDVVNRPRKDAGIPDRKVFRRHFL